MDLVEATVAGRLRELGVSYPKVAKAHESLSQKLKTPFPFAHADLLTDGKDVFLRSQVAGDTAIEDASSRQQFFETIEAVLSKIKLDYRHDGLARRWHIAPSIDVDPMLAFGKPSIEGTGITTFVVARQAKANKGDTALIAELFGIPESAVAAAISFEEELRQYKSAA